MPEKAGPAVSADTRGFWARCNDEQLVVKECTECGERRLYPHDSCPECWSENSIDVVCEGTGSVKSYTVSHRPNTDAFKDDVPYLIALVELTEGVTVMSNLDGVSTDEIEVGMAVELIWERRDNQKIYQFQPAQ